MKKLIFALIITLIPLFIGFFTARHLYMSHETSEQPQQEQEAEIESQNSKQLSNLADSISFEEISKSLQKSMFPMDLEEVKLASSNVKSEIPSSAEYDFDDSELIGEIFEVSLYDDDSVPIYPSSEFETDFASDIYWDEYPDGEFPHNVNSEIYSQKNTWISENGSWYYLNQYGIKAAGRLDYNGNRYYMNSDGSMYTGWKYINAFYYFDPEDGHMLCSVIQKIDGKSYIFKANGQMIVSAWMKDEYGMYYIQSDGTICKNGLFTVGTKTYHTDENGYIID